MISLNHSCLCRKDTSVLKLEGVGILAAMAPPGGGRHEVTARFLRHFNIIGIDSFDEDTMRNIFTPIIEWHFSKGFETSLKKLARVGDCQ